MNIKIFLEQSTSESNVKAFIPLYEVLKTETYKKCKIVKAEPRELTRIEN